MGLLRELATSRFPRWLAESTFCGCPTGEDQSLYEPQGGSHVADGIMPGAAGGRCRSTGPQGYVTGSSRAFHSLAFAYFAGRVPRIVRPSISPRGAPSAFMKAPKLAPCAVRSPEP
jgi:hypothetical protein